MTSDRDLMQCHVDALFNRDVNGDLVRVNEPHGTPAPRFFVGRTLDSVVRYFRRDVDAGMRQLLDAAVQSDPLAGRPLVEPIASARYAEILDQSTPVTNVWAGPAFRFPDRLSESIGTAFITEQNAGVLEAHFRDWIADVQRCQPMLGLLVDGWVVSLCCSVRQTSVAHEAGVETAPAHRGCDYGCHAATAWARAVRERDRVPLYSTSWTNAASRAVARKLGLVLFGNDLHLA